MNRKMLCRGNNFQVFRIISLKTFYKGDTYSASQVWIFTIGLLPSSPPGIPENIDIGGPECKSLIKTAFTLKTCLHCI